jgi:plastocyanin
MIGRPSKARCAAQGIAVLLVFVVAGASPACAANVKVKITDLVFSQAEITVHVGDTVEWVNDDVFDHTATDKDGKWDVPIAAGKTGVLRMDRSGTFEYFCRFHPNMTGIVHVVSQ